MTKQYFVYILASKRNGTLYVGLSDNLIRRLDEHKNELADGFTKKYNVKTLAHYEVCDSHEAALYREKCLKEWKREWKLRLIEESNPEWYDLYQDIRA